MYFTSADLVNLREWANKNQRRQTCSSAKHTPRHACVWRPTCRVLKLWNGWLLIIPEAEALTAMTSVTASATHTHTGSDERETVWGAHFTSSSHVANQAMDCQCPGWDQCSRAAAAAAAAAYNRFPNSLISQRLFINKSTLSSPNNQIEGSPLLRPGRLGRYNTRSLPPPYQYLSPGEVKHWLSSPLPVSAVHAQQMSTCWETCVWIYNPCNNNNNNSSSVGADQ